MKWRRIATFAILQAWLPVTEDLMMFLPVSACQCYSVECVSKSFPFHPCKNCCALFSSDCISTQPESLSRLLFVRPSAKWGTEVVLFSYAWVYKNNINESTDNICLYIDDSATSETACNYIGLEDLEGGPRLLNLKGMQGSEGVNNTKYDQKRQSAKAQHMC